MKDLRPKPNITPLMDSLVALRRARGLRQVDVAEFMGVSKNHVSLIENGHRGRTLIVLEAYAEAVGAELCMRPIEYRRGAA